MVPQYVEVALNLPVRREFTYRLPEGRAAAVGSRVLVPFRGKRLPGIVTALSAETDLPAAKVREVEAVLDAEVQLPPALLQLAQRISRDYGCAYGEALDAMLPAAAKRRGVRRLPHLEIAAPRDLAEQACVELEEKRPEQARVLRAVLEYGAPLGVFEVQRRTNTSDSPWQTLVRHKLLRKVLLEEEGQDLVVGTGEEIVRHELNAAQAAATSAITEAVATGAHRVFLLHGVTGSGKTEVYLHALEAVRARGKTAIVLVPEISLTPQTVGRFQARFPDVAVLHSGLTQGQRGREWHDLLRGRAGIVVGARSALFAPLANLGLIVIDEEHESTFKQENSPRYHAREVAIVRAEIEQAVVVLGSATPSLESYGRARRGVYQLLELTQRAGRSQLPRILVEDLRHPDRDEKVGGVVLTRTLKTLMKERLAAREQVILFLNRRGFAPVLICPKCGTPQKCRRCDVSMTWHKKQGRLVCHYCCEERRRPELCPTCQHPGMHELGLGTERVAAVVQQLFPESVVARMDADTMTERGAHERVLTAFRKKQIDVLVGTQMLAKGHDFPNVTLVGVISADSGLFLPDYRAAERTFQLLSQVAGRAGRADKPGLVVFQTLCPDNYAITAASKLDYESFVRQELVFRRDTGYPPFSRLVRVLFESRDLGLAMRKAQAVAQGLQGLESVEPLGPAPAIQARIQERHRVHIVVKCFTQAAFQLAMTRLGTVEDLADHKLRVTLDVDPGPLL